VYRFATRLGRQSWNTDAMTRRPPAPEPGARRVAQIYGLEAGTVTSDGREAVRQARARHSRRPPAAGLPGRIEDPAVAALLAGLLREPGDRGVVLSGRCGTCGYLLGSSGHQVSCCT
jgi:hypothetical protein